MQKGEKGALCAAGGAGEAGEAAEETRDAPRESGEVAPKPNEEESEQNENKCAAAVGHGGLVRCGGEAGVLFDKGRIRALCAQWKGAVRLFFAYRQKEGEWATTLFSALLELRDGGEHGLVVLVAGGIHDVDQVYQPPKATATAGQQFADANPDVFEDESVDAQSAGEEGNKQHDDRIFELRGAEEHRLVVQSGHALAQISSLQRGEVLCVLDKEQIEFLRIHL